ncbi:MAG TPA: hypothetical protein VIU46_05880 [Gallionellaceae bacterium]
MRIITTAIAVVLSGLAGCADTSHNYDWQKRDYKESQYHKDDHACLKEVGQSHFSQHSNEDRLYQLCMRAKGYYKTMDASKQPEVRIAQEKFDQGDLDEAIRHFDLAGAKHDVADNPYFLLERGQAYYLKGDYEHATDDITASRNKRSDLYPIIWADLVGNRIGLTESELREKYLRGVLGKSGSDWPAPILSFMLAGGPDALLAVANNSNPLDRPAELCEANFYIAEWYLTRKDEQMARAHFAAAIEICPKDFQESRAAKIELKKLKQ